MDLIQELIIHAPKIPSRPILRIPSKHKTTHTSTHQSSWEWFFAPKETSASRRFNVCVHAGEIYARLYAGSTMLADGHTTIMVGPDYGLVLRGELYPWNPVAFEMLSVMKDDLITLLLRFRSQYPNETITSSMVFRPMLRTPS